MVDHISTSQLPALTFLHLSVNFLLFFANHLLQWRSDHQSYGPKIHIIDKISIIPWYKCHIHFPYKFDVTILEFGCPRTRSGAAKGNLGEKLNYFMLINLYSNIKFADKCDRIVCLIIIYFVSFLSKGTPWNEFCRISSDTNLNPLWFWLILSNANNF